MTGPSADALLLGLAAGSPQAFQTLYDRYAGRLYGTALAMLGRREDAEDAVQEVFVALVRSRARLTRVEDLTAYLFASLRHAAARISKHRLREAAASPVVDDIPARPENVTENDPRHERLDRAMQALPPEQREVIAMKIDGELTFVQIGQVLGVSLNTVASRYRYALEKLHRSLGDR